MVIVLLGIVFRLRICFIELNKICFCLRLHIRFPNLYNPGHRTCHSCWSVYFKKFKRIFFKSFFASEINLLSKHKMRCFWKTPELKFILIFAFSDHSKCGHNSGTVYYIFENNFQPDFSKHIFQPRFVNKEYIMLMQNKFCCLCAHVKSLLCFSSLQQIFCIHLTLKKLHIILPWQWFMKPITKYNFPLRLWDTTYIVKQFQSKTIHFWNRKQLAR